jgi:hypothetical protein
VESHVEVLAGGHLGEPSDETGVEGTDDGAVGVAGVDAEWAVPDVDGDKLLATDGRAGSERQVLERLDDDAHRLLDGGVAKGASEFATPAGSLLLGGGGGRLAAGRAEQRDETGDEETDLGIPRHQRLAQLVALGRAAPTGGDTGHFLEHSCVPELVEVSSHRRRIDAEELGELRDLAGSFLEGLDDGQAARLSQEAVALRLRSRVDVRLHRQNTMASIAAARNNAPR